jgi:hypothetical protein
MLGGVLLGCLPFGDAKEGDSAHNEHHRKSEKQRGQLPKAAIPQENECKTSEGNPSSEEKITTGTSARGCFAANAFDGVFGGSER